MDREGCSVSSFLIIVNSSDKIRMIKPLGDAFDTFKAFFPHMGFLFLAFPYGMQFSFISKPA